MPMAIKCNLFSYADDTCLVFQSKLKKKMKHFHSNQKIEICRFFIFSPKSLKNVSIFNFLYFILHFLKLFFCFSDNI